MIDIREIDIKLALTLRQEVLWPEKTLEFCHVQGDDNAKHFGVFVNKKLVNVASVYDQKDCIRLRKFATKKDHQGSGYGTKMILWILKQYGMQKKFEYLWCDARIEAVDFYKKINFISEGEVFVKSNKFYIKMRYNF